MESVELAFENSVYSLLQLYNTISIWNLVQQTLFTLENTHHTHWKCTEKIHATYIVITVNQYRHCKVVHCRVQTICIVQFVHCTVQNIHIVQFVQSTAPTKHTPYSLYTIQYRPYTLYSFILHISNYTHQTIFTLHSTDNTHHTVQYRLYTPYSLHTLQYRPNMKECHNLWQQCVNTTGRHLFSGETC